MSSVPTTSDNLNARAVSLMQSLLGSLTAAVNANSADTSAFSSLLSQIDTAVAQVSARVQQPSRYQNTQQATVSSTTPSTSASTTSSTTPSDTSSSSSSSAMANSSQGSSSSSTSNATFAPGFQNRVDDHGQSHRDDHREHNQASTPTASTSTAQQNSCDQGTGSDSGSAATQSSLGSLMPGNQALSALPSGVTSASTGSTTDPSTTSTDPTSATTVDPQYLAALLQLMIHVEKKALAVVNASGAAASGATANAGNLTAPSGDVSASNPSTSPSDAQLKSDLKDILSELKALDPANNDNNQAVIASQAASPNTVMQAAASSTANTPTSSSSTTNTGALVAASDASHNAQAGQFDVLNFLNPSSPGSTPPSALIAATTLDPAVEASQQEGASADLSGEQQGTNAALLMRSPSTSPNSTSSLLNATTTKSTNPYSFASQLTAMRSSSAGFSTAVDQVALQLNRNVKNGNDEMTLQLNPTDLGRVNIKLDITSDGKVTGTVTADNRTTLNLLSSDSRSLERSLQDAGFQADPGSLQFSMSGQSGHAFGQTSNNSSGNNNDVPSAGLDTLSDPLSSNVVTENYYITPTGVNLSV